MRVAVLLLVLAALASAQQSANGFSGTALNADPEDEELQAQIDAQTNLINQELNDAPPAVVPVAPFVADPSPVVPDAPAAASDAPVIVHNDIDFRGTELLATLPPASPRPSDSSAPAQRNTVVSTSWSAGWIACLTIGCILAAAGISLVLIGIVARVPVVKGDYVEGEGAKAVRWPVLIAGIVALVVGAILIGTSVGVTASSGSSIAVVGSGARAVIINDARVNVISVPQTVDGKLVSVATYYTYVNNNGVKKAVYVIPPRRRTNSRSATEGEEAEEFRMPKPSEQLASLELEYDPETNTAIVKDYKRKMNTNRGAVVGTTGTKSVVVYRVSFSGRKACGTEDKKEDCQAVCSMSDINDLIMTGTRSANTFYKLISKGAFSLSGGPSSWFDATVPEGTSLLDVPAAVERAIGVKTGDFHAYFVPPNFLRNEFAGTSTGLGEEGGVRTWMKRCELQTFTHEFMHNLFLGHAGSYDRNGNFQEYRDISSVMGMSLQVGGSSASLSFRGLGASQISQLQWLPAKEVLQITFDGTYGIASLSGNEGTRAAQILQKGMQPLWLELRTSINQDVDILAGQIFIDQNVFSLAQPGKVIGSILIKSDIERDNRAPMSSLLAIVEPGRSATTSRMIRIQVDASVPGRFTVTGLGADSNPVRVPPSTSTTTTSTTTERAIPFTDAPRPSTSTTTTRTPTVAPRTPSGPSCRDSRGRVGQCIVASTCTGTRQSGLCKGAANIQCCFQ